MRPTIAIHPAVGKRIERLARQRDMSFESMVNELLQRGLYELTAVQSEFRIEPHAGNLRPGIDDTRLNELAWELDDPLMPSV